MSTKIQLKNEIRSILRELGYDQMPVYKQRLIGKMGDLRTLRRELEGLRVPIDRVASALTRLDQVKNRFPFPDQVKELRTMIQSRSADQVQEALKAITVIERELSSIPKVRRVRRAMITYRQIVDRVKKSRVNKARPFIIVLKAPHSERKFEYRFNGIDHLENAIKLDESENYLGREYAVNAKQYFENVSVESVRNVSGGCNRRKREDCQNVVKGKTYSFTVHCPLTKDNSCAYHSIAYHTKTELSNKLICEKLNLALKEKKTIDDIRRMWNLVSDDKMCVIDRDFDGELQSDVKYILLDKEHYTAVISWQVVEVKAKKSVIKRNTLTWDCETRQTSEFITIRKGARDENGKDISYRSYKLKDTITKACYMGNRGQMVKIGWVSTPEKSSIRQFIEWLAASTQKFKCYAHNGASFDNYFFINQLTEDEYKEAGIVKLGLRFASVQFEGHELTDSRLHLVQSLDSLCSDYKVETPKMTEFVVNGRVLTNTQMCFYRPELSFDEFMGLQQSEPEFWDLYEKYCEVDCVSLYQIWQSYSNSMRQISEAMMSGDQDGHTKEGGKLNISKRLTVGSGAMDLLEASMELQDRNLYLRVKDFNDDVEKEEFLRLFIRGGISHTGQPGAHHYKVTDVDIVSQYPAAMYHGKIPVGKSRWVDGGVAYNRDWCGYVHMRNLVFSDEARKNKFLAMYHERADGTRVLQWDTPNHIDELHLDTVSINYYMDCGLLRSFEVVKALVSNHSIVGREVYGLYIDTLFQMKAQQDVYKAQKHILYNPSLRSSIKLCLNSVTGKCVENKLKHEKRCSEEKAEKVIRVNGQDQFMQSAAKINPFLPTGLSIYSNSKILLREYVECLPNGSDDMIHAETDGFMFRKESLDHFKQMVDTYHERVPRGDVRESLPIAFGGLLGNIGVACETDDGVSYFLGKKNYLMSGAEKGKDLIRLKGVPQKTIEADGTYRYLVSRTHYEDMYDGKTVSFRFQTLLKTVRDAVNVSAHEITRSIKLDKHSFKRYD